MRCNILLRSTINLRQLILCQPQILICKSHRVSSNVLPADFRKMRTDSFQKSRIIPTIPQSDADCDEVGHQQGHGPSLPANEREGV